MSAVLARLVAGLLTKSLAKSIAKKAAAGLATGAVHSLGSFAIDSILPSQKGKGGRKGKES